MLTRAAAFALALLPASALAVFPPYYPDEELVNFPIIVVARWDRGPVEDRGLVEGDVRKRTEMHLTLDVTRVIKGDLAPGKHTILMTTLLTWRRDGSGLETRFSSWVPADVGNIAEDNLWLLSRQRSCRQADPAEYPCWNSLRCAQPLILEPYFQALNRGTFSAEVPALLAARDPALVLRTLAYLAGGVLPDRSPEQSPRWKKRSHKPLAVHADAVEKLLGRAEAEVRRAAARVYAQLAGREAVPRTRLLLGDPDPVVRVIAVDVLAEHRDDVSLEAICRTVQDIERSFLGCRILSAALKDIPGFHAVCVAASQTDQAEPALPVATLPEAAAFEAARIGRAYRTCDFVERLAARRDERLVPALIALLQNESLARQAQAALTNVTGYTFPLDAQKSQRAWEQARKIAHPGERREFLAKALPYDPEPLAAKLVAAEGSHAIVVANRSKAPIALAKAPSCIDFRGDRGMASGTRNWQNLGDAFVELAPGTSTQVSVFLPDVFVRSTPQSRKIIINYGRNGNEAGVNAWIGDLAVAIEQVSADASQAK